MTHAYFAVHSLSQSVGFTGEEQHVVVVVRIHPPCERQLAMIAQAGDAVGLSLPLLSAGNSSAPRWR